MDDVEPQIVYEISHPYWNDDRLIRGDLPEGATVEMIKVGMSDEDEIDLRQVMNLEPRLLQALDHLEPF